MSHPFDEFSKMVRDLDRQWADTGARAGVPASAPRLPVTAPAVIKRFKADSFSARCRLAGRFVKLAARVMWRGQVTLKLTNLQDSDNLA